MTKIELVKMMHETIKAMNNEMVYYEEEVYEERRGFITNPVVEIVKRDGRSDEGIIMPHDYVYNEGDILYLLKMPFDHDGHHATGRAIWKRGSWVTEYEED